MATITPVAGRIELISRLGRALGITFPFSRLVIECDVNSYVKVYVVAPADYGGVEKVCDAVEAERVESVQVNPDASVLVVPLKESRP